MLKPQLRKGGGAFSLAGLYAVANLIPGLGECRS
jgi:hypothetical protein